MALSASLRCLINESPFDQEIPEKNILACVLFQCGSYCVFEFIVGNVNSRMFVTDHYLMSIAVTTHARN